MIEVDATGSHLDSLKPALIISGGRGNVEGVTEVNVQIRRGNHIDPLGWFRLDELLVAVHAAGAMETRRTLRLIEPSVDEWIA